MKKILFTALFVGVAFSLFGQAKLSDINFERIPFKKVRHYIQTQIMHNVRSTDDLVPSFSKEVIPDSCSEQVCMYELPVSIDLAWEAYSSLQPDKAWNGRKAKLAMLVNKIKKTIFYPGDAYDKIDTGQVVYLNLRVLNGVTNVGVAFEVINIDEQNHVLEFSYLKGNKSLGKQQLYFSEHEGGTTLLKHVSYFKSDSKFRDKFLYPYFHKRFTNEFHRNMVHNLQSTQAGDDLDLTLNLK